MKRRIDLGDTVLHGGTEFSDLRHCKEGNYFAKGIAFGWTDTAHGDIGSGDEEEEDIVSTTGLKILKAERGRDTP